MRKLGRFSIGGLENKVFNLCILLVLIAIGAFAVIGIMQLNSLNEMTDENSKKQAEVIKDHTQETMTSYVQSVMLDTAVIQTKNINDQFWTLKHDFYVLASQVQEVFDSPENFVEKEISKPDKKNKDKTSLQLLSPNEDGSVDDESYSILSRIANLGPMMKTIIDDNPEYIMDVIVALPNGVSMAVDRMADQKYDEDGKLKSYDPRKRPWFTGAVENHDIYFSQAIHSFFYDMTEVVFGMPVYKDGELAAVLEGSIKLDMIQKAISETMASDGGFCTLVNNDGQVVYSPITEGDLAMDDELSTNAYDTENEELKKLLDTALQGAYDYDEVTLNNEKYYVAFAPIETVKWTMMLFIPHDVLAHSADALLEKVDVVAQETKEAFEDNFKNTSWITLLVLVALIVNAVILAVIFARRLLKPIHVMTNRINSITGDDFIFEFEKVYMTGDEIEVLAKAFSGLSEKNKEYTKKIMQISAEKEKMLTELSIAHGIQQDSLPGVFPAFPDRHEFDIYASMTPAKSIGGDFYDMFFIDDEHLAAVIADVSDKGVPAALFMMTAKTTIRARAMKGGTPAEILEDVNNLLAENNKSKMFVTVFLAIMNTTNGLVVTANAGHEYPIVRPVGGEFEFVHDKHGFVLGGVKGMKYVNNEFIARPGDMFFLYTDGLIEANNSAGDQFGEERLLKVLNEKYTENPKELLEQVQKGVNEFAGDEPQFDDLTMLSVTFYGEKGIKSE